MKIDLFENKYKPSNAAKIFFADVVCFLLVAIIAFGVCYSYLSGKSEVTGSATTANVEVEYQHNASGDYAPATEIYVKLNDAQNAQTLSTIDQFLTPGDKITILGRVVSKSNVSVYVLAKLEIETVQKGVEKTEVIWINIGNNDPAKDANGDEISDPLHTSSALAENAYLHLSTKQLTAGNQTNNVYQIGAGSLGAYKYKDFNIPYTFDGTKYENGDEIKSVKFSLHAHQKDHLENASDFDLYKQYESQITGYDIKSIYAAHYITGDKLTRS